MKKTITLIASMLVITISEAQTWTTLTSGSTSNFKSIHFPTSSVGYVTGTNGTILKTINGGTTWQSMTSNYPGYFFWDVHFTSADTGFVCGESNPGTNPAGLGIILKTINGGINWTVSMSGNASPFRDLFVLNRDTVFVCGGSELRWSKIYKSVDGGTNWGEIGTSAFDRFVGGMYFLNSEKGFLADYESGMGTIHQFETEWLATTDGGISFTSNIIPGSTSYWNFSTDFPNQLTGYMSRSTYSTGPVSIRKTIDGGNNWTENAIPGFSGSIYGLDFITQDTGYVVGGSGVIMKTNDGGSSWVSENSGVTDDLSSVYFVNDALGFAAGSNGKILKRTSITTGMAANYLSDESLNVYPNPFSLSVFVKGTNEKGELILFDITGKEIMRQKTSVGETKLNTENISSGFYLLHYSDEKTNKNFKVDKR